MTIKTRRLGRTNWDIAEIGFGAWAIGGSWGDVNEADARASVHAALDAGMTFIDTADVYGDGRSERIIRDVLRERRGEKPIVATKAGRRLSPHLAEGYTKANLEAFVDRSLTNLGVDALDLVQLHCPPTEVYYRPEVFGAMDDLVAAGKIRFCGVSVEKVEEALKALAFPNVSTVQIIFNMLRHRPAELLFPQAMAQDVGVIVRVPLASGMLTGKMRRNSTFAADDHRHFNRHGEAFDVGETFSGVPFDVALEMVEDLRTLVPGDVSMAQYALRCILMEEAVSVVIPGAKNREQATRTRRPAPCLRFPPTSWTRCGNSMVSVLPRTCISVGSSIADSQPHRIEYGWKTGQRRSRTFLPGSFLHGILLKAAITPSLYWRTTALLGGGVGWASRRTPMLRGFSIAQLPSTRKRSPRSLCSAANTVAFCCSKRGLGIGTDMACRSPTTSVKAKPSALMPSVWSSWSSAKPVARQMFSAFESLGQSGF